MVIGLTGGIGTGKSTVARMLAELGAEVIDADRVGHEAYRPGSEGWKRVVAAFGREIVAGDGTIDRKALGRRVLADPQALAQLNAIVHPLMEAAIRDEIQARQARAPDVPVVLEAAVLLEAGWRPLVDRVWVVTARPEQALERVCSERGLTREQAERWRARQLGEAERLAAADLVIENTGTIDELRERVKAAWEEVVGKGRGR